MNPYNEILTSLSECINVCEICASTCLEEDYVEEMGKCIKLNRDCADICSLGVQLLARNSELSDSFIGLCADICSMCAEECEKHEHNHCKKCAETCRRCEEICKSYLDKMRQALMNA